MKPTILVTAKKDGQTLQSVTLIPKDLGNEVLQTLQNNGFKVSYVDYPDYCESAYEAVSVIEKISSV